MTINLIKKTILISVLISSGVFAMGLSNVGKVCLFSKMSGVIKQDGKPVANAKLVRTVNLNKDLVDETTTDENGNFEFEAKFTHSLANMLPQEFAAKQVIWVHYNDNEYKIWSGVKRKPEENIESRGKPLVVECELNSEKSVIEVNNSPIISMCTWDVEPDKQRKVF